MTDGDNLGLCRRSSRCVTDLVSHSTRTTVTNRFPRTEHAGHQKTGNDVGRRLPERSTDGTFFVVAFVKDPQVPVQKRNVAVNCGPLKLTSSRALLEPKSLSMCR
jgi:hypothetical protein